MKKRIRIKILKLPLISYCGIDFNNRRWSHHLVNCEICSKEHTKLKNGLIASWAKLCECGCGQVTSIGNKYIVGHTATNIKRTPEQKLKYKALWTPEKRAKWSDMWKKNNPLFKIENRRYGENNPAKREDVRIKISENNPMHNAEHKKKCIENRRKVGYAKTIASNKRPKSKETIEKQIKTYCTKLANGEIKLKNNWKCGTYIRKNGLTEWFDSSYEEIRMIFLDENNYIWAKKHGIKIPYVNQKGQNSYYVPDFKIINKNQITIEEVKGWIKENDVLKAKAGIQYCKKNKIAYRFLLGKELIKIEKLSYEPK